MCLCLVYYGIVRDECKIFVSFFSGYTLNIYVEMFHSEKQFDELEIFDGKYIYTNIYR